MKRDITLHKITGDRRTKLWFLLAFTFGLIFVLTIFVTRPAQSALPAAPQAPSVPPIPNQYYGRVRINNSNVISGTQVSAWCGGVKVKFEQVFEYNAESWYSLDVPGDDPVSGAKEGCSSGETVNFYIDAYLADQTDTWSEGGLDADFQLTASLSVQTDSYQGQVRINGENVPLDTQVSAWCSGTQVASNQVTLAGGVTNYSLSIPGDIPITTNDEGCAPGEAIIFKIGEVLADQQSAWQSGGQHNNFHLTATTVSKLYLPLLTR